MLDFWSVRERRDFLTAGMPRVFKTRLPSWTPLLIKPDVPEATRRGCEAGDLVEGKRSVCRLTRPADEDGVQQEKVRDETSLSMSVAFDRGEEENWKELWRVLVIGLLLYGYYVHLNTAEKTR
ncbi:hypothetical protein TNIN_436511 [Trichonephila inaurata madagascariensis]|uniref:Uncharacterized protein n=1 Tax=Trichonephila inaurata madagascariensis TaxID=2747483 RepID=A0A8X6Y568_9ARAC|nr:hypothetical protein TNIN_436511 [Trichonephila inaurata madagascariensis]